MLKPVKDGFAGDGFFCEDFDECATDSHQCHEDAMCANRLGSYECICNDGFTGNGTHCEIPEPEEERFSILERIMQPLGMWSSDWHPLMERRMQLIAPRNRKWSKFHLLMIQSKLFGKRESLSPANFDLEKWIRVRKWWPSLARRLPAAELRCGYAGDHKRLEIERKRVERRFIVRCFSESAKLTLKSATVEQTSGWFARRVQIFHWLCGDTNNSRRGCPTRRRFLDPAQLR